MFIPSSLKGSSLLFSFLVFSSFLIGRIHGTVYTLSTDLVQVGVTVTSSFTCLSSLQLSLSLANDMVPNPTNSWTPNLLTGVDGNCGSTPSGTGIATTTTNSLVFPQQGNVVESTSNHLLVNGITFPGTIATETWNITLMNSSVFWIIQRQYESDGIMIADSFPAIWVYSTTGGYVDHNPPPPPSAPLADWRATVQIPSFLSLDDALLNPETGYGYPVANNERIAVLGDSTTGDSRRIMLSPSGIAMHMTIANGRFAMYRNPSIFTQTIGMGAENAVGPYSTGYTFYTGDTKETLFRLDFLSASQGHGYFDFQLPATASPTAQFVVNQMNIMSQIFQLPMGWVNGNSPQCETCVHEISIFPQLNGLFRIVAPPSEASSIPNPSPFDNIPSSSSSCPAVTNPFCGYNKQINTVTLSLECAGGVITEIQALYGTPVLSPSSDCFNFTRNPSCDDPNFLSYAQSTCVGQASCTLIRQPGDFDPCPNIEKAIVASATCSSSSGGRVVPVPGQCPTVHDITGKFLSFLLSPLANTVSSIGQVSPRWDIVSGNDWGASGIIDQYPHFILAVYYHLQATNATSTVLSWLPMIRLVMNYMLDTMLVNTTYLLTNTNPMADGVANHSLADNWLDDVRFGWNDGIVGAYAVEAFRAYADILVYLNQSSADADFYYTIHQQMLNAYNDLYWDPVNNMYHDWVDKNGIKRNYFYTWQNFLAIELGIANATQAAQIINTADQLYADIRTKFNFTQERLWCTPTNLIPLSPSDLTVDFDGEYVWPAYENGDCFHWHFGLESLARSKVNGSETAFTRLQSAMMNFNVSRLWGQRYSFIQEYPVGSDVITDGYFLMYGSIWGSLNIRPTLLNGIVTLGPAAPEFEGSNFTFALYGNDVTVQVKNNYATVVQ